MTGDKRKVDKAEKKKEPTNLSAAGLLGDLITGALETQTKKMDITELLAKKPERVESAATAPKSEEPPVATPLMQQPAAKKELIATQKPSQIGGYERFLVVPDRAQRRNSVYVREATHEKLLALLRRLENRLSLAEYLENIIEDHFEKYGPEMKKHIAGIEKEGQLKF